MIFFKSEIFGKSNQIVLILDQKLDICVSFYIVFLLDYLLESFK